MRNSLSELENLAIAVGNVVVINTWSADNDIYMCRDLATNASILIQVPKNMELKVGKTYSILGRLCNHDYPKLKSLSRVPMVYIYSIKRSRISSIKGVKFFLPLPKTIYDISCEPHIVTYSDILISTKETEKVQMNVLIDDYKTSLPELIKGVHLLEASSLDKRHNSDNGSYTLMSKGNIIKFDSLKWVAKNFNIAFN